MVFCKDGEKNLYPRNRRSLGQRKSEWKVTSTDHTG